MQMQNLRWSLNPYHGKGAAISPRVQFLNSFRDDVVKVLESEFGLSTLYYSSKSGYRLVAFHPRKKSIEPIETATGNMTLNNKYGLPENGTLIDNFGLSRASKQTMSVESG